MWWLRATLLATFLLLFACRALAWLLSHCCCTNRLLRCIHGCGNCCRLWWHVHSHLLWHASSQLPCRQLCSTHAG
jgi:hypothetical protein